MSGLLQSLKKVGNLRGQAKFIDPSLITKDGERLASSLNSNNPNPTTKNKQEVTNYPNLPSEYEKDRLKNPFKNFDSVVIKRQ
ncbi:hypothetical protein ACOWOA_05580 [Helicobacter pylori]